MSADTCPKCHGAGGTRINGKNGGWVQCTACKGSGSK